MSKKIYIPKPSSLPDRVLTHLRAAGHPPVLQKDFGGLFGTPINNIGPGLKAALAHGLLQKIKVGGRSAIALGDGQGTASNPADNAPAPTTTPTTTPAKTRRTRAATASTSAEPAPQPTTPNPATLLTLTRWSDGDVFVQDFEICEGGQLRLTPEQLQQLVDFVCLPAILPANRYPF